MKANRLIFYAFMFHIYLWLVQQITRFGCTQKRRRPTRAGYSLAAHPSRLSSPPASCPKMELTFLKLNESAVSGKWISNICLEKHITKSKKKKIKMVQKTAGREAKLTVEIRLKYASSDSCALPAFGNFSRRTSGLKS